MTQISNPGLQSQKTKPPKTRTREFGEDDDRAAGNPSTLTGNETAEGDEEASDQFDQSDIDLNISYSDSDKEVPFK